MNNSIITIGDQVRVLETGEIHTITDWNPYNESSMFKVGEKAYRRDEVKLHSANLNTDLVEGDTPIDRLSWMSEKVVYSEETSANDKLKPYETVGEALDALLRSLAYFSNKKISFENVTKMLFERLRQKQIKNLLHLDLKIDLYKYFPKDYKFSLKEFKVKK